MSDTSGLERHRRAGGAGAAGCDPAMLLGLLVYAYYGGVRSSRRIEQLCLTDVAYRVQRSDLPTRWSLDEATARAEGVRTSHNRRPTILSSCLKASGGRLSTWIASGPSL